MNSNRKYRYCCSYLMLAVLLSACRSEPAAESFQLQITEMTVPATSSSMFPSLTFDPKGQLLLNWLYEPDTVSHLLMTRLQEDGQWSPTQEMAAGTDWFINWADFPSLAANVGGHMLTYALPKSSDDTYAYDIGLFQSMDQGSTWNGPIIPHPDGIKAEHGFVSFFNLDKEKIGMVWLDGRNYGMSEHSGHDSHDTAGETDMTLRFASIDWKGQIADDYELDPKVCSCCQTDAAPLKNGAIVVYRDRDEEEIRDIAYVRLVDGQWTAPKIIGEDLWEIAGCPVNGPAVATNGENVVVSWYTGAAGEAQVKVAFSKDNGVTFGAPIRLDAGQPLGRVDAQFWDTEHALVSWVEQETPDLAAIRIKLVHTNGTIVLDKRIADFDPSRSSGFPRMAVQNRVGYLAWTGTGEKPLVRLVKIE